MYPLSPAVRARSLAETEVYPGTINSYAMYRGSRRGIYLIDYYARMEKREIAVGGPTGPRPEGVSLRPEDIVARAAAVLAATLWLTSRP